MTMPSYSITAYLGKNKRTRAFYLLSFLIPSTVMLLIFILRDIYPFGDRSFLHIDMYHQYFPFLTEFYHKLGNGESLFYSWNTGIGSNFLALYAYYLASPFNWLCVLVPEQYLMEFLSYMVVFKTGLCGLTFAYYGGKHFRTDSLLILCFSVFYALSGFMAAYNWDVMWLDVIVLAPIVILGVERLVSEGKCRLYCITLGLSILTNYYLSIMLCIFLVLYFIVLLIGRNPSSPEDSAPLAFPGLRNVKNFYGKAIVRFGVYSLLAGGMAAILLFPEIAALWFTEFSDINFPSTVKTYFSVIDMLARHCFNVEVETGLDHWPNIYCGVAVFLLLPLYAIQKKIPLREKVPKLLLLAFMLVSFSTNVLNFIWHGFNYPDSLPARQSFLYILLLLTVCCEACLHIRECSNRELTAVCIGVLFFLLLCEKVVTDDAFTGVCFLVTGIFLALYVCFICYYRHKADPAKYFFACILIAVVTEAGANTYLTSVPTVSRTTYLSNYDSYQTLTKRTVEQEDGDFFRFEKFARRTQNDAMLIGFHGASYFSSTQNSLVSDFYEKYGMRASRVNYCFEGATPVTAALLSNRYMLYTMDRGYDSLFALSDTEGRLYLYRNNYSLPLGYMVTEDDTGDPDGSVIAADEPVTSPENLEETTDDAFSELFSTAEDVEENLHEDEDDDGYMNPIQRQNSLVHKLGVEDDVFLRVELDSYGDEAELYVWEDAHYYAYTPNTKIDNIQMNYEDSSKTFSQIKKKYILDLGYHKAGEVVTLKSENGEKLNLTAYKTDETALCRFIDRLGRQTMIVDGYDETSVQGHINVDEAGQLVLSIPYESGWTLYVDGEEAGMDLFEDTFISVFLAEGSHTIELKYFPKGFIPGIVVSVVSLLLFTGLCCAGRRYRQ